MTKAIDDLAGLVRHTDPNESKTNGDAGEAGQTEKVPISLIWKTPSTPLVHGT